MQNASFFSSWYIFFPIESFIANLETTWESSSFNFSFSLDLFFSIQVKVLVLLILGFTGFKDCFANDEGISITSKIWGRLLWWCLWIWSAGGLFKGTNCLIIDKVTFTSCHSQQFSYLNMWFNLNSEPVLLWIHHVGFVKSSAKSLLRDNMPNYCTWWHC